MIEVSDPTELELQMRVNIDEFERVIPGQPVMIEVSRGTWSAGEVVAVSSRNQATDPHPAPRRVHRPSRPRGHLHRTARPGTAHRAHHRGEPAADAGDSGRRVARVPRAHLRARARRRTAPGGRRARRRSHRHPGRDSHRPRAGPVGNRQVSDAGAGGFESGAPPAPAAAASLSYGRVGSRRERGLAPAAVLLYPLTVLWITLQRMARNWRLLGALLAGLVLVAGLAAAVPIYTAAGLQRSFIQHWRQQDEFRPPFAVIMAHRNSRRKEPVTAEQLTRLHRYLDGELPGRVGHAAIATSFYGSFGSDFVLHGNEADPSGRATRAEMSYMSNLAEHADVSVGRWYEPRDDGVVEVMADEKTLDDLELIVGARYVWAYQLLPDEEITDLPVENYQRQRFALTPIRGGRHVQAANGRNHARVGVPAAARPPVRAAGRVRAHAGRRPAHLHLRSAVGVRRPPDSRRSARRPDCRSCRGGGAGGAHRARHPVLAGAAGVLRQVQDHARPGGAVPVFAGRAHHRHDPGVRDADRRPGGGAAHHGDLGAAQPRRRPHAGAGQLRPGVADPGRGGRPGGPLPRRGDRPPGRQRAGLPRFQRPAARRRRPRRRPPRRRRCRRPPRARTRCSPRARNGRCRWW